MLQQAKEVEKQATDEWTKRENFFAGKMGRVEAEDVLRTRVNSTFLLRESESQEGAYTISIRDSDQVFHFRVGMLPRGQVYIDPQQPFDDFRGLVRLPCLTCLTCTNHWCVPVAPSSRRVLTPLFARQVVHLQGQDSIGGYPAQLRLPFRLPESHLSHVVVAPAPQRPSSAGSSRTSQKDAAAPTEMSGKNTKDFNKDVALLLHQRAVCAAKGSVMLLYARVREENDEDHTGQKVAWIKHHLTLQGWRVWVEADHVNENLGLKVAQQIVLAAVEMCNVVVACTSRGFTADGCYAALALEHARQQKPLNGRVFTIRLREIPKENSSIFGLHM